MKIEGKSFSRHKECLHCSDVERREREAECVCVCVCQPTFHITYGVYMFTPHTLHPVSVDLISLPPLSICPLTSLFCLSPSALPLFSFLSLSCFLPHPLFNAVFLLLLFAFILLSLPHLFTCLFGLLSFVFFSRLIQFHSNRKSQMSHRNTQFVIPKANTSLPLLLTHPFT